MRFLFLVFLFLLVFCTAWAKPLVVTSVFPLYLLVRDISGNRVHVEYLTGLLKDPHIFEVKPSDIAMIKKADLLVFVGCGLEKSFESILVGKKVVYVCEKGMNDRRDPHVWLYPSFMKQRAMKLAEVLSSIDPNGSSYYRKNVRRLFQSIDPLLNEERAFYRKHNIYVVSRHSAWKYMAGDLGWVYLGEIERIPHVEPKISEIMKLIDTAKKKKPLVLLNDAGYEKTLVDRFVNETGACIVDLFPMGIGNEQSYVDFLKRNLERVKRCVPIR